MWLQTITYKLDIYKKSAIFIAIHEIIYHYGRRKRS